MNSIFLRLYLLIVFSIVAVGFSIDYLWQQFEPEEQQESQIDKQLELVALQLDSLPALEHDKQLNKINIVSSGTFSLLTSNHSLYSSLSNNLRKENVLITQDQDSTVGFSRLKNHPFILSYRIQIQQSASYLKLVFIGLFYSIIALSVWFWILPLSKDLNRLEKAVSGFDKQQWQSTVKLPTTSSVTHLANAYNELLDRIRLLVETQQAMSHSISHELRTPLARVRFSLEMAQESQNIDDIKVQLNSMSDDVVEMNQLINELLNFSALEKTSTTAKLERGNINLLIDHLLNRLDRNFPDRDFTFNMNDSGKNVLCDSYLIERAIQNLLVNAGKFSEKKIVIEFTESEYNYQLSVDDDGPGVDSLSNESIFESFVQLENGTKQTGFGLGLAIVKRVMALHHGQALIEKSSMGGARFLLIWPKQI